MNENTAQYHIVVWQITMYNKSTEVFLYVGSEVEAESVRHFKAVDSVEGMARKERGRPATKTEIERYAREGPYKLEPTAWVLPDGSGAFTASFPLPKTHWLYAEGPNEPPTPLELPAIGRERLAYEGFIRGAARYAVRAATMNGKEPDFDPDSIVQNMIVGLLGSRKTVST